jgi:hypothetical protein
MDRHRARFLSPVILAGSLVATAAAAPAGVLAVEKEASLCDAVALEAVNALSPMQYADIDMGSGSFCVLETADGQQGPHTLMLVVQEIPFGIPFEEMVAGLREQGREITDLTIGGRAAFVDASFPEQIGISIDLGDRFAAVTPSISESAEGAGVDPVEHAIGVAELLVAGLETGTSGSDGSQAVGAPASPPELEGVRWSTADERSGEDIESAANEDELAFWDPLLEASGRGYADVRMTNFLAFDTATDERIGTYSAWSIGGADMTALLPMLVAWLRELSADQGAVFEQRTLAGKEVTSVSVPGSPAGVIYAAGDTFHIIQLPDDERTEALLAALP